MLHLHPHPELHPLFETLGYALGFAAYKRARRRDGDVLPEQQRWSILAAAIVGALVGSRLLGLLEQAPRVHITLVQALLPGGGKTIVGGLLGGWLAVELTKKFERITTRTGDLFAVPLCIGIAVGRIGCFFAGLADDTFGKPTALPWAVDFGDGIARHPTQLYEIVFLAALAFALSRYNKEPHTNGATFRLFMAAYLTWRLLVDFLKPQPLLFGINLIQWTCMFGLSALLLSALLSGRTAVQQKARGGAATMEPTA